MRNRAKLALKEYCQFERNFKLGEYLVMMTTMMMMMLMVTVMVMVVVMVMIVIMMISSRARVKDTLQVKSGEARSRIQVFLSLVLNPLSLAVWPETNESPFLSGPWFLHLQNVRDGYIRGCRSEVAEWPCRKYR